MSIANGTTEAKLTAIKTQMEALLAQIAELTERLERDDLTQLYRRQAFFERLDALKTRADREGKFVGILVSDIDHFKKINDTHGHLVGDHTLKQVAEVCRSYESERVLCCRFGGEEFVIAVAGTSAEIAALAEELRSKVAAASGARMAVSCTVSIGVSFWNNRQEAVESALDAADRALYQAKEGGRNRVVVSESSCKDAA